MRGIGLNFPFMNEPSRPFQLAQIVLLDASLQTVFPFSLNHWNGYLTVGPSYGQDGE